MGLIEVERRAVLADPLERDRIYNTMLWLGGMSTNKRIMIVYTDEGKPRTTLRIDNGKQKIVTKSGGLADAIREEETEYPQTPLDETLAGLAAKGFEHAVVGRRDMWSVKNDGVEISLRDVRAFNDPKSRLSTLVEVEALKVGRGEEAAALDHVERTMKWLHLTPLTDGEFETWAHETHAAADQPFTYSPEAAAALVASIAAFATS